MNKLLTDETRPRIASGVSSCTRVWRTMTLMLSAKPQMNSISIESQNKRDQPKPIVASPKMITAAIRARPAFFMGGRWAMSRAQIIEPTGRAAVNSPNPCGPTFKMSLAYCGQQAGRAAKQDGEQIQRDGAQDDAVVEDKAKPAQERLHRRPPASPLVCAGRARGKSWPDRTRRQRR